MTATIQPGDILLMTRIEDLFIKVLCKCICELDNYPAGLAPVCHAAIIDRNLTVASMEESGLNVETLDHVLSCAGHCWQYRVKDPAANLIPVLDRIDYYEKQAVPYAFMDYALLPFIVLSRKIAIDTLPLAQRIELRGVIDECCQKIENLIRINKNALICSELVFRCLTEGGVPIEILNAIQYSNWTGSYLRPNQLELLIKLRDNLNTLAGVVSFHVFDGEPLPNWVTPGDLLGSSSLTLISQLK